jgi:hypothetical protein
VKILFVLHAPRKIDGVGDYTSTLSNKLVDMGHHPAILGLDYGSSNRQVQKKYLHGVPLTLFPWSPYSYECQDQIRDHIREVAPDWLSFQFVNYAWNVKGIVFHIIPALGRLFSGFNLHMYFHEIWVGFFPHSSFRKRIVGLIQKSSITFLARAIAPKVIHTNSSFHLQELKKSRFQAQRNPLFGNIPFNFSPDSSWIYQQLHQSNINISPGNRESFCCIGLFGNVTEAIINQEFHEAVQLLATKKGITPVFLLIGILRVDGQVVFNEFCRKFADIKIVCLGHRSAKEISDFLQFIDFACATSPLHLVEKSGTFAALVEHGVPTLVFESIESGGIRPALPANAHLFRSTDLTDWPKKRPLARPCLLDLHAKFFFDSLLFNHV